MTVSAAVLTDSLGPTPERARHDRIARADATLADSDGGIGAPWLVESMLERMQRRGDIGSRERAAGEEFGRLFQLAHLDPLRASDVHRTHGGTTGPHGTESARRRILAALDALGGQSSPAGACCWYVLGCEMSLATWSQREGWAGRPLNPQVAKGILVAGLGCLSRHFRT